MSDICSSCGQPFTRGSEHLCGGDVYQNHSAYERALQDAQQAISELEPGGRLVIQRADRDEGFQFRVQQISREQSL